MEWVKEDLPRWDDAKQRLFDNAGLRAVGMGRPSPDTPLAAEWWQVVDDDGTIVGYGWLDSEWGDAQITFFVDPARRGAGIGKFVLDHLENEAHKRGLNYIYNVVPESHPDRAWMTAWLESHGLTDVGHGDLRRRVVAAPG